MGEMVMILGLISLHLSQVLTPMNGSFSIHNWKRIQTTTIFNRVCHLGKKLDCFIDKCPYHANVYIFNLAVLCAIRENHESVKPYVNGYFNYSPLLLYCLLWRFS